MYRHLRHGTFVVACWVNRDEGLFLDMLNLGKELGMTREMAEGFSINVNNRGRLAEFMGGIKNMERDFHKSLAEQAERNAEH